jgi:hypothetical protein
MVLVGQLSSLEQGYHAPCIDNHVPFRAFFVVGGILPKKDRSVSISCISVRIVPAYFSNFSRSQRLYHFPAFLFAVSLFMFSMQY